MIPAPLAAVLPEASLALGVIAILIADLVLPPERRGAGRWIGMLACVGGLAAGLLGLHGTMPAMLAADPLTTLARPAILIVTALVLMAGRSPRRDADDAGAWAATITGLGFGALITAASSNLISLYLGLETMSLAGYALAAWRGGDRRAAEAGMKYVLFGGGASALMLFGMSHLYGMTGHLDYAGIGAALEAGGSIPMLAAVGIATVGIAYKLSLVPFHFYAPDVYEGAPAIAVAAVGTLPKFAAAAALVRFLWTGLPGSLAPGDARSTTLATIAVVSLLVAAFTALSSRDAKRIIAFSAIGHAGSVLLAIACLGREGIAAGAFYLAAYAAANLGALVCLGILERERGSTALAVLAGSMRRRPWLTGALCLFLLSLAGVPPTAGFLAKWGVLREALRLGLGGHPHLAWAALGLLLATVVSAWAYLLIIRALVLQPAPEEPRGRRLDPGTVVVIATCAVLTLALGLWLDGFAVILQRLN